MGYRIVDVFYVISLNDFYLLGQIQLTKYLCPDKLTLQCKRKLHNEVMLIWRKHYDKRGT